MTTTRRLAAPAAFALLLALAAPLRAEEPADRKAALDAFATFVEKAREEWGVPGVAVTLVQGDEVVMARGFGLRDRERALPASSQTLFALGSCTKAFTTFVLATLVDEGKLAWEKPVRTWLPDFALADPEASARVTPLDLVAHRTGLARHDAFWINGKLSRAEMVRRLRYLPMAGDLRAQYEYSNLPYVVAGELVEKVTGATWEEAVRQRVLLPLGMYASTLSVRDSQKASDHAVPYEIRDDEVVRTQFRDVTNIGPAGSLNATAEDLGPWLRVLVNGGLLGGKRVISGKALAELFVPRVDTGARPSPNDPEVVPGGYALGWATSLYRGVRRVSHGGAVRGFGALVTFAPDRKAGVAVLGNVEGSGFPEVVARHALDLLLDLPQRDWSAERLTRRRAAREQEALVKAQKEAAWLPRTRPTAPLDDYAGAYEHPGYGTLAIARRGEGLAMTYNDITTPLEHWHHDVWNGLKQTGETADNLYRDQKLVFRHGLDGSVDGLEAPLEPKLPPVFFSRRPEPALSDPATLARYAGSYLLGARTLVFGVRGADLVLGENDQAQPLTPVSPRRFREKGATGRTLEFVLGPDGNATSVRLLQTDGAYAAGRVR